MPWRATDNVIHHVIEKRESDPLHARIVGTSSSRQVASLLSLICSYRFYSANLGARDSLASVVFPMDLSVKGQSQHLNSKWKENRKMQCEYRNKRGANTHLPDTTWHIGLVQLLAISMHSWARIFKSYLPQIFRRVSNSISLTHKCVTGSSVKPILTFTDDYRCSKRRYNHIISHTNYEHTNISVGNDDSFARNMVHESRGGAYSAMPSYPEYDLREGGRRISHQHIAENLQPFLEPVRSVMKSNPF